MGRDTQNLDLYPTNKRGNKHVNCGEMTQTYDLLPK